jgi:hypothetical protein
LYDIFACCTPFVTKVFLAVDELKTHLSHNFRGFLVDDLVEALEAPQRFFNVNHGCSWHNLFKHGESHGAPVDANEGAVLFQSREIVE